MTHMYRTLSEQLESLSEGVGHAVTVFSNASALLYNTLEDINWAGFYFMDGSDLILGPFQGKPACMKIPAGKGVCGACASKDETVLVPDVHAFPGHIACDSASNSEIVIPLHENGQLIGVLDIDSPVTGRFSEDDKAGLELFAETLEKALAAGQKLSRRLY